MLIDVNGTERRTRNYKEGACGHPKNVSDENHCVGCLSEYVVNEEWLQCPICKIWFHSNCFYEF